MRGKDSPQNVIDSYRRRQQTMPFIVGGLAVLLVAIGIIILVVWFTGSNKPSLALFASATPTPTSTFTPTPTVPTATPTFTLTPTETPTITVTFTPAGPFEYQVQEKDTCWDIAAKYKVDLPVLLALNGFENGQCPISPGQKILIPTGDQKLTDILPTETPIPTGLPKGTKIEYVVQQGDTLAAIAAKFNSTKEAIMAIKENELTDENKLVAFQKLIVPINMVTPVPTKQSGTKVAGTATATSTAKP